MSQSNPSPIDPEQTKKNVEILVGFAGVLLGLLVTAISTIHFEDFNNKTAINDVIPYDTSLGSYSLITAFALAVFLLIICIMLSFSVYLKIPLNNSNNNDLNKVFKNACDFFTLGVSAVAAVIFIMLFHSFVIALMLLLLAYGVVRLIDHKTRSH